MGVLASVCVITSLSSILVLFPLPKTVKVICDDDLAFELILNPLSVASNFFRFCYAKILPWE